MANNIQHEARKVMIGETSELRCIIATLPISCSLKLGALPNCFTWGSVVCVRLIVENVAALDILYTIIQHFLPRVNPIPVWIHQAKLPRAGHGSKMTFINPASRRYKRSNQVTPSDNGATALIRGSTRITPDASISRQAGDSPAAFVVPYTDNCPSTTV